MSVLIVDDNEDVCDFLDFVLSSMGLQTHVFTEPTSALSYVKEQHIQPDFLITDYNLPCMTGHQLHQQMHAYAPDLKTIIISGRPVQEHIDDLPFLLKPFSPAQVTTLVEALQA